MNWQTIVTLDFHEFAGQSLEFFKTWIFFFAQIYFVNIVCKYREKWIFNSCVEQNIDQMEKKFMDI